MNSGEYTAWVVPVFDELAKQDFSAVEENVGSFVPSSKTLMDALDEVAKIHTFIQGI